jgi:4-aminobutyrate aminotransferase-like enzyme/Ser/Thr protein kinase RdoA (MazF antagonist)/murein DD-endopeptidase MepM/ murein hydrolase activator NlpD
VTTDPAALRRAAEDLVRERFGVVGTASPLPGERTHNFLVSTADPGSSFVLKLHDALERDGVCLEAAALDHLTSVEGVPRTARTTDGEPLAEVMFGGRPRLARLLHWLPGRTWAASAPHRAEGLAALGALVARVDRGLAGFTHPAAGRYLRWNLAHADDARALLGHVADPRRRELALPVLDRFASDVAPRLRQMPAQPIHNDANDLNVLVDDDGRVTGLIDFGDLCTAPRVCGLAVACTYAMALPGERPSGSAFADPVRAVLPLVAGYHGVSPLQPAELELLLELILTRLALSICVAGWQHAADPTNGYLLVSQGPVLDLLERLTDPRLGDPSLSLFRFRDACGYEADPRARRVRGRLAAGSVRPVVGDRPLAQLPHVVVDLRGDATSDRSSPEPVRESELGTMERLVDRAIAQAGAEVGLGRYLEHRDVYRTPAFAGVDEEDERRTVHLGVDLFAPAGTPVRAPLGGVVHALADNAAPEDYGPVVLLRHDDPEGAECFTLYGHLSRSSLAALDVGRTIAAGEVIATVGTTQENGGWPPHLHLQILTDLVGLGVDVPGVARRSELGVWRSISPDPNLLLRVPSGVASVPPLPAPLIAARRSVSMSPALSLSYAQPLHIVTGRGARLVDAGGRDWLDLVNNVAHVGHAHPRVVAAAAAQQAVLNTNTRYLHQTVVEYARRLSDTLPDPLNVCFFVNSGSEANDLALRLAYAHTASREVLTLDHAYHGNLTSLVEVSPYKFDGPGGSGPGAHTHVVPLPDPYRGRYRGTGPEITAAYLADLDAILETLADTGRHPAALLAEAIPGTAGQVMLAPGFLPAAFDRVRAAGGVGIADEVQTGFGRVGSTFWAFELSGARPDIVTLGKPIGNGHPLGAVVTTPEVAASFLTGMEYFNTFGGNPVSAAVGLAVLDVVADEGLQARALRLGERLLAGLRHLADRHPTVGDVRGAGLFLGVELVADRVTRAPDAATASALVEGLKRRGILISSDGPDHNVLKIKPPLVLDETDCDAVVAALDAALDEAGG